MTAHQSSNQLRRLRSPRRERPLPTGTVAPAFTLPCALHRTAALDDFRGRPVVLAFYVADWHPVCTAQLSFYQDLLPEFERLGAALVGISADTLWSQAVFARVHGLTFPLLSDRLPRGNVARGYGVYDSRAAAGRRALFMIDRNGVIRWRATFPEMVNPGADGVLSALESLATETQEEYNQAPGPLNP